MDIEPDEDYSPLTKLLVVIAGGVFGWTLILVGIGCVLASGHGW